MPAAEELSVCRTFLAMGISDLDRELSALNAERVRLRTDDQP
jgi:hypothetical protein